LINQRFSQALIRRGYRCGAEGIKQTRQYECIGSCNTCDQTEMACILLPLLR